MLLQNLDAIFLVTTIASRAMASARLFDPVRGKRGGTQVMEANNCDRSDLPLAPQAVPEVEVRSVRLVPMKQTDSGRQTPSVMGGERSCPTISKICL